MPFETYFGYSLQPEPPGDLFHFLATYLKFLMSKIHWKKKVLFNFLSSCVLTHIPLFKKSDLSYFPIEIWTNFVWTSFCMNTFPSKGPGWNSRDMASKWNSVKSTLLNILKTLWFNQFSDPRIKYKFYLPSLGKGVYLSSQCQANFS